MKTLEQLQKDYPQAFQNAILTGYRGSHSHGTFVPNTETSVDDIDLMSVIIPNSNYYFGLDTFGSRDTLETVDDPWDVVSYEIKKFVRLLMKGNPNVIGMLYLNPEHYLHLGTAGHILIDNRSLFNSQAVYHSFIGYSKAQFYKMTHLATQGYMGAKRKGLVERFGYDCKNAAHLIRLMRMCNEWLVTREFKVYREKDREELIDIKSGKWTLDQVNKEADKLFLEGEALFQKVGNSLLKEVDKGKVNLLLDLIFKQYYNVL